MGKSGVKFGVKYEGKTTFETIKKDFEKHLSKKVIHQKTAAAINETLKRSVPIVHKAIREKYNIKLEDIKIDKSTHINYARPKLGPGGLWGSISIKSNPIDMTHFKHRVKMRRKKQAGVTVEVMKGRSVFMKHLFRTTIDKYTGVFGRGKYINGRGFVHERFLTSTGKVAITKMRGPSPFAMLRGKEVEPRISQYIQTNFPARLRVLLQLEVDKIGK